MEIETLVCPLCGAPDEDTLVSGTLLAKCRHCGGLSLVPSRFTGLSQHCPNHPDSQSVGLCSKCGQTLCDRCLRVVKLRGKKNLYLCSKCTERYLLRRLMASNWLVALGVLCFVVAVFQALPVSWYDYLSPLRTFYTLQFTLFSLVILLLALYARFHAPSSPTLEEKRRGDISHDVEPYLQSNP